MENAQIKTVVFQDNITTPQDGVELGVSVRFMTLNVLVETTSASGVVNFEAKTLNEPNWTSISGVNLSTFDIVSTTSTNGIYQIDLTGLSQVRCRISDITDGVVTVTGKVVG